MENNQLFSQNGNKIEVNNLPSHPNEISLESQDARNALKFFGFENLEDAEEQSEKYEYSADELLASNERFTFLVDSLFLSEGLVSVAGPSDLGKSSLLRQLAIDIVRGSSTFLGFSITAKYRSAVVVCTEDDKASIKLNLEKHTIGIDPENLKKLRFIFDSEDLIQRLDLSLAHEPADLVILDCFSDVYGGDLKDSTKIRAFLKRLQRLSVRHRCLIILLHHTGKRTEYGEPSKNDLLSGQGFEAKMRLVIVLRADLTDLSLRHLCIVKGNYLPSESKRKSIVLRFDEPTLTFSNTGNRTFFSELSTKSHSKKEQNLDEAGQMAQLADQGMTYEEIAKRFGYGSRGTVSKKIRLVKAGNEKIVSNGNTGNDLETKYEL